MNERATVLVVDDAAATVEVLSRNLTAHGLRVVAAGDVAGARRSLRDHSVDLVVTDLKMPGESGLELVRYVRAAHPGVGVVMITGYPSIETAIEAVKSGAEEYLPKPFTDDELLTAVDRVLAGVAERRAVTGSGLRRRFELVTASAAMAPALRAIDRAAASLEPVLVVGPAGSGRTAAARAVHRASSRGARPFVTVSCRTAEAEWLAQQLLGGDGGPGLVALADGGSLVLDEVEWLEPRLQVEVLRTIQQRSVAVAGRSRPVDVRWIATAAVELTPGCRAGGFRRDLAVLLGSHVVTLPALGARSGDLVAVAQALLDRRCAQLGRPPAAVSEAAAERLRGATWPGDVATLEAILEAALERTAGETVVAAHLPLPAGSGAEPEELAPLAEVEAAYIRRVLARVGDNKSEAARVLGIDRKTLRDRLRRLEAATARSDHGGS